MEAIQFPARRRSGRPSLSREVGVCVMTFSGFIRKIKWGKTWLGTWAVSDISCWGGLKENGFQGSGNSRCGLVGVHVLTKESVLLWGWTLRCRICSRHITVSWTTSCCLQLKMLDTCLLLQYHVCFHTTTPHHDESGLTHESINHPS